MTFSYHLVYFRMAELRQNFKNKARKLKTYSCNTEWGKGTCAAPEKDPDI